MNNSKKFNVCIAGLGTVGSNVIYSLNKNHQLINKSLQSLKYDLPK